MLHGLSRQLLAWRAPAGAQARLSILIFHRVLPAPDPLFPGEVDAARFGRICAWVARWFNVLPLDAAVQRLRRGDLPARALAITFDDGYEDNHSQALPILQRHGLPATFFVATGFLDGGRMWNDTVIEAVRRTRQTVLDLDGLPGGDFGAHTLSDAASRRSAIGKLLPALKYLDPARRQAAVDALAARAQVSLPGDLMMSSQQVRSLHRAGMQIGAHTVTHPILARVDDTTAHGEITQSKAALERLLGDEVKLFAYPNGKPGADYGPSAVDLARRAGFAAAVSTRPGSADADSDAFQLPRFTPWRQTRLGFGAELYRNLKRPAALPLTRAQPT